MIRFIIVLTLVLFSLNLTLAQSKIEKLKFSLDTAQNDTVKAALLRSIGNKYRRSNYDSSMYYYLQSIQFARKANNENQEAKTLRYIGIVQKNRGNTDSALVCYNQSLEIYLEKGNDKEAAYVYNNIGIVNKNLANYDKAISDYIKALKIFDKIGFDEGKALVYNNIGIVHKNQQKFDVAIEYYYKALEINKKLNRIDPLASNYNNIGALLIKLNLKDSALTCYLKARSLREKDNDEVGVADSDMNIGNYYSKEGDWDKAIAYYYKSLPVLEKQKSAISLIHGYLNVAKAKYSLAKAKNMSKSLLDQAEEYTHKSLELAKQSNYLIGKSGDYELLAKIYTAKAQYKEALSAYMQYKQINDSLFNIDRSEQMANTEAKYNSEKKQIEIEKLKKEQEVQQIENKRQKFQKNAFLIGAILLILFVINVLRNLRQKKKANKILFDQKSEITEKNEELNQMIEEVTTQKEEIESQRDMVANQNELLEQINNDVSRSIDYATRLQQSILPEKKILEKYLSDFFVLLKPKDKVSGDFYWWTHIENHTVITAVDCTGHGVPGAFMSMLGVSYIREIVQKEYITHTGVILRKLRKEIIKSLNQKGESGEQKDGMDMAIISINHETKLMQFSGANNPLYIVKKDELKQENNTSIPYHLSLPPYYLYEIKPDKMPIAIYDKMEKFTTHEIQLEEGDQVYLFSDGFPDQFGGPKDKKFKYKPFKQIFLENAEKSMIEQKKILNSAYKEWKGSAEQVDDVVIVGVKV